MLLKIREKLIASILARKLYIKKVAATRYDPVVIVALHAFGA